VADDRYGSLSRPPLDAAALRSALAGPGRPWRDLQVVATTGSTNSDLAGAAREGAVGGLILVAEEQTGGRGRLDRSWTAPPRSGLTFSVLLRPAGPPTRLGWLPLLAGLAAAEAVGRVAELDVRLKWPNDLLVGERKLGGILAERVGDAVVLGFGLNVSALAGELPGPAATSLVIEGAACTDRDPVLRALLRRLADRLQAWDAPGGDPGLAPAYADRCATLGRVVRAELPGGKVLTGLAEVLDDEGRLGVRTGTGLELVGAGDVVHLR
jgi:BirA family transcriptional regulator, biotin operon repressor / biotin---[acetyl-CoA-carboxylase] ligase